jgi:hypothetical protein
MHNCTKTQALFVDLLFSELDTATTDRVTAEADACPDCRRQLETMREALIAFDRAAEAAMPEESFWAGYHERLRDRLADETQGHGKVIEFRLPGKRFAPVRFTIWQAVAAVLALAALGGGLWAVIRPSGPSTIGGPIIPGKNDNAGNKTPSPAGTEKNSTPVPLAQENRQPSVVKHTTKPRRQKPEVTPGPKFEPQTVDLLNPEAASHFEKAQQVLRSVRNSGGTEAELAETIAYEKQVSRSLIYRNVVLRREAERSGNVPLGDVLNRLEPLLIDIANLPDKPSPGEVDAIRARVQRKEIIATLETFTRLNESPMTVAASR